MLCVVWEIALSSGHEKDELCLKMSEDVIGAHP